MEYIIIINISLLISCALSIYITVKRCNARVAELQNKNIIEAYLKPTTKNIEKISIKQMMPREIFVNFNNENIKEICIKGIKNELADSIWKYGNIRCEYNPMIEMYTIYIEYEIVDNSVLEQNVDGFERLMNEARRIQC